MMKRLVIAVVLLAAVEIASAQEVELVCTPCGQSCDDIVLKSGSECSTCGMKLVPKSTANVTNLDAKAFCARITENPDVIILDVRSEREFKGTASRESFGHFKNAININIDQLSSRVSELSQYKDREILVYCSHSHRSPRAAYYLGTQGFKNVKNLTGGVSTLAPVTNSSCYKENYVVHH